MYLSMGFHQRWIHYSPLGACQPYILPKFPQNLMELTQIVFFLNGVPLVMNRIRFACKIVSYEPGTKQRNSSGWSNPASKNIPIITIMNIALGDVHESCEVCTIIPKRIHIQKISQIVQIEKSILAMFLELWI